MKSRLTVRSDNSEHDVQVLSTLLSTKLLSLGVALTATEVGAFSVELGIREFGVRLFHPFRGVTAFHVQMTQGVGGVLVEYEARLTELAWWFAVSAGIVFVAALQSSSILAGAIPAALIAAAFYISSALTRFKINALFRELEKQLQWVRAVVSEEPAR